MTTPPVIVQPDLEAWVWQQIGGLPGVNSFAYAATQAEAGWVYHHFIQVDCRHAKRKDAARALAEQVRQILYALPGVPWPGGVVSYAQPVEGPFWFPDNDGMPRYVLRFEFRVHPAAAGGTSTAAPAARPPRRQAGIH